MINTLVTQVHQNAKDKGFYEFQPNIAEKIALIHSEVSEALEADREDYRTNYSVEAVNNEITADGFKEYFEAWVKDTFEDELADICIRVFDLAGYRGINLEEHIKAKMRYNSMREYKHGKKY